MEEVEVGVVEEEVEDIVKGWLKKRGRIGVEEIRYTQIVDSKFHFF